MEKQMLTFVCGAEEALAFSTTELLTKFCNASLEEPGIASE